MSEQDIQSKIMAELGMHPRIAWVYVTSVGTYKGYSGGRPVKIGFPGQADIMGQLRDGRLLALEVKQPGKVPTTDQYAFLQLVNKHKGMAGWADSIDSALALIEGENSAYSIYPSQKTKKAQTGSECV